jgi:hypothetical protein
MPKKTKPVKARNSAAPDEGVLANLLTSIEETGGLEVRREMWFLAETLAARGLITLGPQHGQNGDWRRAEVVKDVAQLTAGLGLVLDKKTDQLEPLPLHFDRKPWTCRCNSTHAADAEECGRCFDKPPWPPKRFENLWNTALKHVDPPLPPPVPGVEPATAFAERLAHKLCAGEPLPAMVIEILRAVRERDAAIVKAKDDERDGC